MLPTCAGMWHFKLYSIHAARMISGDDLEDLFTDDYSTMGVVVGSVSSSSSLSSSAAAAVAVAVFVAVDVAAAVAAAAAAVVVVVVVFIFWLSLFSSGFPFQFVHF